jgi:hypothetical protein
MVGKEEVRNKRGSQDKTNGTSLRLPQAKQTVEGLFDTLQLLRCPGHADAGALRPMKASRSALTRSLRVVHIPCGAPS